MRSIFGFWEFCKGVAKPDLDFVFVAEVCTGCVWLSRGSQGLSACPAQAAKTMFLDLRGPVLGGNRETP